MWKSTVDGRTLHFRLAAINNQNFIMSDEATGSWWQQVTGEAIDGPLAGKHLELVSTDRLTFGEWRREHPEGRVLRPDPGFTAQYYPAGFENTIARFPTVTPVNAADPVSPRALVAGIALGDRARAYPLDVLTRESPVMDRLGDTPLVIALGADGESVRAFDRRVDGRELEFVRPTDGAWRLVDVETRSEWDFAGHAVSGPMAGRTLTAIPVLVEYWFDWRVYHPPGPGAVFAR